MLKEIHEQPRALRQCLRGRVNELEGDVALPELDDVDLDRVHLVAAGTSYHAAIYGAQLLSAAGVPAQAYYAHEYAVSPPPIENATVVGVSQSGETADTLAATREARRLGADTLALTNTVGSTMARECDRAFYIRSGPEIGVAATKTFAGQQTALNLLAEAATPGTADRELVSELRDLPGHLQEILDGSAAETVADEYLGADAYFFVGRGVTYPVALEGALKMKEISYEHAEGFAAGELKHDPLALVTAETPVFATVIGDGEFARKTIGTSRKSRHATPLSSRSRTARPRSIATPITCLRCPRRTRARRPFSRTSNYSSFPTTPRRSWTARSTSHGTWQRASRWSDVLHRRDR